MRLCCIDDRTTSYELRILRTYLGRLAKGSLLFSSRHFTLHPSLLLTVLFTGSRLSGLSCFPSRDSSYVQTLSMLVARLTGANIPSPPRTPSSFRPLRIQSTDTESDKPCHRRLRVRHQQLATGHQCSMSESPSSLTSLNHHCLCKNADSDCRLLSAQSGILVPICFVFVILRCRPGSFPLSPAGLLTTVHISLLHPTTAVLPCSLLVPAADFSF